MSLKKYQNIKSFKDAREQGFTIVELLIVIIVIAILAALVISAYTGIQGRASTSANRADAKSYATAISANLPDTGTYPATLAATNTVVNNTANSVSAQITAVATPTGTAGQGVGLTRCTSNGVVVRWWDASTGAVSTADIRLGITTTGPGCA